MSEDTYNPVAAPEADAIDAIEPDVVLDLTDDASEEESEEVTETPAWAKPGKWYVVHSQSGYEKKVELNLKTRIQSMDMDHSIYEIVIPMEDVVEFKQGQKKTVQKKSFPWLPLGSLRDGRRHLVLHSQHTWRHRIRRTKPEGSEANSFVTQRS